MKIRKSLAYQLLKITFSIYVIVTVSITTIHMYVEWRQAEKFLRTDLRMLGNSSKDSIIVALWGLDYPQMESIVKGMLLSPIISGVKVKDEQLDTLYGEQGNIIQKYKLEYKEEGMVYPIGELIVFSDSQIVFNRVQSNYAFIVVSATIKTLALWFIVLWVGKKMITEPLNVLTNANQAIDLENLETFKEISIGNIRQNDNEIKILEASFNNMVKNLLTEKQRIMNMTYTFEKFVPKQFLNRISNEGLENIELGTAQTEILTILFSDIRSFTELSESMSPQELLNFMNAYLRRMNQPIHNHHGFIDKFIGDAIMALFDHPENSAMNGVEAAIGMQATAKSYNQYRAKSGYSPIALGIGIHTGEAIIGTIGSEDRMDSTVLGDAVNLASRLESLTKYYQTPIIISSDTHHKIKSNTHILCRELDYVSVKGRKKPTIILEVYNNNIEEICDKKQQIQPMFEEGLVNFRTKIWKDALLVFKKCIKIYPNDYISQMYIERCHNYMELPPPKNWDGVFKMVKK
ncbi:MAG: adenylate/guanylate cyclase domain-containing protein [Thiomargarita sp.]|nr:adenylate/guanylate cyclase domain-containing protein [Thiomargarita sp.]